MRMRVPQGTKGALLSKGKDTPVEYVTRKEVVFEPEQFVFLPNKPYEKGSMAYELGKRGLCGIVNKGEDPKRPKHILIVMYQDVEQA